MHGGRRLQGINAPVGRSRAKIVTALLTAVALVAPASAAAVTDCEAVPETNVLYQGDGVLESIGVDARGRLFFSDSTAGTLMMLKRPGAEPATILEDIKGPGGIVFRRDGKLVMGQGNGLVDGAIGNLTPRARLVVVDPASGETRTLAEGLQMANGIARGPGQTIFASVDLGSGIDRIRGGEVEVDWATPLSPNGLVVDSTRQFLFVAQTFTLAAIQKIPLDDPAAATTYYSAGPTDVAAGFDGLTRDGSDRLYVAANGAGQVWRIDGPAAACSLLNRDAFPDGPSDLAFGRPRGAFPAANLYVTTFGGELIELVGVR